MHGLPQPTPQDTIAQLFPDTQLGLRLWTTYVKNVDPVLKILHIPTVQSMVVNTIVSPQSVEPSSLALVFAIFFAAVTSLSHNELATFTHSSYRILLAQYATGLNLALLMGDCLNNPKVSELQALATYAVSSFPFLSSQTHSPIVESIRINKNSLIIICSNLSKKRHVSVCMRLDAQYGYLSEPLFDWRSQSAYIATALC